MRLHTQPSDNTLLTMWKTCRQRQQKSRQMTLNSDSILLKKITKYRLLNYKSKSGHLSKSTLHVTILMAIEHVMSNTCQRIVKFYGKFWFLPRLTAISENLVKTSHLHNWKASKACTILKNNVWKQFFVVEIIYSSLTWDSMYPYIQYWVCRFTIVNRQGRHF